MTSRIGNYATRVMGLGDRKRALQRILGAAILAGTTLSTRAQAAVVINEIFTGGGTSQATVLYKKDWVELYNTSSTAFDLSGFRLSYATSTGSFTASPSNRFEFPDGTMINGNGYLLITLATPGTAGADLDADLTTESILMSANSGKLRLVDSSISNTSQAISGPGVLDFIGYGPATTLWEGTGAAPVPTLTTSLSRDAAHTDTNDNAHDFTAGTPTPTKSSASTPSSNWTDATSDHLWNTAGNWSPASVPNAPDAIATLPSQSFPSPITLSSPIIVGTLSIDSVQPYTLSGAGPLTFSTTSGIAKLDVAAGNHTLSTPVIVANPTQLSVADGSSLTVTSTITANSSLSKVGSGTAVVHSFIGLGSVAVSDGTLSVDTYFAGQIFINGTGRMTVATGGVASDSSITIFTTLAQTGLSSSGTTGLVGAPAIPDARTAYSRLAVVDNSLDSVTPLFSTFLGQPATATSVLLFYTYNGDTNLDGKLDGTDLSTLIESLSTGEGTGWENGDVDYSGTIDATDYALFLDAYNNQGTPYANPAATDGSGGSIPEPTHLLALALPAVALKRRGK